jgi:hypothetical protein
MDTQHASRDTDVASAGRIVDALNAEARERTGTEQAYLWAEITLMLERRWPQPDLDDEEETP